MNHAQRRMAAFNAGKATEALLADRALLEAHAAAKAATDAALAAERKQRLAEIAKAEAGAIHAAAQTTAIEYYRRKDGTLVREHIRGGVPVVHPVHGEGFVRAAQLLDPSVGMISFYPLRPAAKKIGSLFPVSRTSLAVDRRHRNFPLYAAEIAIAIQTAQDLRLSWAN